MDDMNRKFIKGVSEDVVREYIGANADYYMNKWTGIKDGKVLAGWNWSACFAGILWLGYRKMYKQAVILILVYTAINIIATFLGNAETAKASTSIGILIGAIGNHLYLYKIEMDVKKAEMLFPDDLDAQKAAFVKKGGTSWRGVAVAVALVYGFIVITNIMFNLLAVYEIERGLDIVKEGKMQQAVLVFDKAINYNEKAHRAYFARGISYAGIGEKEKALKDMSTAIQIDENNDKYYFYRGMLLYSQIGNVEEAMKDYDKAVELNPKNSEVLFHRGNIYAKLNKYELAAADYKNAIEVDPQNPWPYYNLAVIYIRGGERKEAVAMLRKFIELHPTKDEKEIEKVQKEIRRLE